MANNEFGEGDLDEDEVKILLSFFSSKKSNEARHLISGIERYNQSTKKSNQAAKKSGKSARSSKYLTSKVKKSFNLLQNTFTQTSILQHFDLE